MRVPGDEMQVAEMMLSLMHPGIMEVLDSCVRQKISPQCIAYASISAHNFAFMSICAKLGMPHDVLIEELERRLSILKSEEGRSSYLEKMSKDK